MNLNSLGERLREARKALKQSQDEMATTCGVSREMWGKYERDMAIPGGDVLMKVAAAGADVLYILTGIEAEAHGRLAKLDRAIEQAGKHVDSFEDTKRLGTALNAQMQASGRRERNLLDNYRSSPDSGKKLIEATAAMAAAQSGAASPKPKRASPAGAPKTAPQTTTQTFSAPVTNVAGHNFIQSAPTARAKK